MIRIQRCTYTYMCVTVSLSSSLAVHSCVCICMCACKCMCVCYGGLCTEDSKDTTFYRIRFSSVEKAKEFKDLANAKQEEASKAALNGSTNP